MDNPAPGESFSAGEGGRLDRFGTFNGITVFCELSLGAGEEARNSAGVFGEEFRSGVAVFDGGSRAPCLPCVGGVGARLPLKLTFGDESRDLGTRVAFSGSNPRPSLFPAMPGKGTTLWDWESVDGGDSYRKPFVGWIFAEYLAEPHPFSGPACRLSLLAVVGRDAKLCSSNSFLSFPSFTIHFKIDGMGMVPSCFPASTWKLPKPAGF